jgi:hypothetical protein
MTTSMKGSTWMHLKTQMQFTMWMKFLNMNESDHHPCGWISSTIDNCINVINFNELSFINMVIWYECYSDVHVYFYINIVNICCQFQSCEQVSFICSNFIQVIYSLMLSIPSKGWDSNIWSNSIHVKIHRKATSATIWPNFIHVIRFIQMYHTCSQNLHGFHPSHLIFISRLIPYWHQCHACGKTQFPVKFIQYPLSRKWSV